MEDFWLGHRERLRLRAQESGLDALRPHELVELVLFYAVPRVDMTDTARALVQALGSPQAVFHAPREALMAVPGVTKTIADWLVMTGELIDAYAAIDREALPRIWRFRDVLDFLEPRWRDVPAPQCWMLYTDYDSRLMTHTVLCDSLLWADPDCSRRIVEEALALQARHAVLILFVGDGPLELEADEKAYMVSLSRTLRAIDVELLDCVLAGEKGIMSANIDGGMEDVRRESGQPELYERYCEAEEG